MMKNQSALCGIAAILISQAATVNAAVVYSGPDRNLTYEGPFSLNNTVSLFDAPGTWDDMRLSISVAENPESLTYYTFQTLLEVHGNYVDFAMDGIDIRRLGLDETVGSGFSYSGNLYAEFSDHTQISGEFPFSISNGQFQNTTGYAGMRLTDGENIYYGWIQVAVTDFDNSNITGTVIDWAYENTPGASIQTGAVPEASSSLLLLGSAALGLLRRNRRGA